MNYQQQKINTIAVNENKQAIFPWKRYQSEMITNEDLAAQMNDYRAKGVAVICGTISGGLEVIDIDTKYETYPLWDAIKAKIPQPIYKKLHIVQTRSKGYHLYYRCEEIEGNQKLAQRLPTETEVINNPQIKSYCIIETRGEAGYVVAPPSNGYSIVQEGINVITIDERTELFEIMVSFNEIIIEIPIEAHNRPSSKEYGLSPFEDFNKRCDFVALMENNGWKKVRNGGDRVYFLRPGGTSEQSGNYHKGLGLFIVFSANTPFEVSKGYKPAAVYAILEHNGDFKAAARALLNLGYGEKKTLLPNNIQKKLSDKKQDGATKEDLVKLLVKEYDKDIDEAQKIVKDFEQSGGAVIETFWDRDKKNGELHINRYKLQVYLTKEGGFRLYFYNNQSTSYRLIRIKDGFVEDSSTEQVKKFIKEYVNTLPDEFDGGKNPQDLLEVIYRGANVFFSEGYFEFFERANIEFLQDTPHKAYFPFKNGIVEVTKDSILLKTYGELNKYVWRSQVIDRDIIVDPSVDINHIQYARFIELISGEDATKYNYAVSIIGYLLHQYKDPSRPFAVILAEENDNEEKGGGTGKGIFIKALSYIVNTIRVDGKNFKIDKNFAFQRVDIDTRIVAIEDTRKKVDFEGFYSIITEGITVEKKNKDELFIPYKDSPKIMFTTNYTIPQTGGHAKRRQRVLEFAPFFSDIHTPEDEFGNKLFDGWADDEWNRFFNFMFLSINDYLENGLINMPFSNNMAKKAVRNQFGDEFLEWFLEAITVTEWVSMDALHLDFLNTYGMDKKEYSRNRFSRAIKCGTQNLNVEHVEQKGAIERGKIAIKFKNDIKNSF